MKINKNSEFYIANFIDDIMCNCLGGIALDYDLKNNSCEILCYDGKRFKVTITRLPNGKSLNG